MTLVSFLWDPLTFAFSDYPTSGIRADGSSLSPDGWAQFDSVSKVYLMEVSGKHVPYKCMNDGTSNSWHRVTQAANRRLWYHFARRIQGKNTGEISHNENKANPHKGMTPPPTQNLKVLGLWVFFLIYCSTFSFLPNVRLRLILEYLTISPSSESPSSTLIHSPSSGSNWPLTFTQQSTPYLYRRSHTYTVRGGNTREISHNENKANPHKGITPPPTQNLKALGKHWGDL